MIRSEFKSDTVSAALSEAIMRLGDLTPLMSDIGELMLRSTSENFAKGTDPHGTPWAAKSDTTLKAYKRRKERVDTRPLHGPTLMLSRQIHYEASATGVEWGSNMIYAAVMQLGAKKGEFGTYQGKGFGGTSPTISLPWGDIPARPYIGVGPDDETAILAEVRDYLSSLGA